MLVKEGTIFVRQPDSGTRHGSNTNGLDTTRMKRRRIGCWSNAFLPHLPIRASSFLTNTGSISTTPIQRSRSSHQRATNSGRRMTISANSLEDSKRRAKSQYDNIPDLNQQYLSELNWVERKYGPKKLKKVVVKESQNSILRRDDGRSARPDSLPQTTEGGGSELESDLSQYVTLRNELIGNTLFLGGLGLCAVWGVGTIRDVMSFGIGLVGSLAYVVLLSRSVDRLAEGAKAAGRQGVDALQPARIAILVFLVLASAKNSDRVSILPVLFGFFTYKLATLLPLLTGEAFE